jgi:hypothetical protein
MTIEPSTGEITQPTRQQASRAIKAAVYYGFLAPDSGSECLVVPAHSIRGGRGTEATEHMQCPVHVKKAEAARMRAARCSRRARAWTGRRSTCGTSCTALLNCRQSPTGG